MADVGEGARSALTQANPAQLFPQQGQRSKPCHYHGRAWTGSIKENHKDTDNGWGVWFILLTGSL